MQYKRNLTRCQFLKSPARIAPPNLPINKASTIFDKQINNVMIG